MSRVGSPAACWFLYPLVRKENERIGLSYWFLECVLISSLWAFPNLKKMIENFIHACNVFSSNLAPHFFSHPPVNSFLSQLYVTPFLFLLFSLLSPLNTAYI